MTNAFDLTNFFLHLERCGYTAENVCSNYAYGEGQFAPVAAFAQRPHDARSACIAIAPEADDARRQVTAFRALGAPVVFLLGKQGLHWWKPGATEDRCIASCTLDEIPEFFRQEASKLAPEALFRAKNFGLHQQSYQQDFVDVGLLPFAEGMMGKKLTDLFENVLKEALLQLRVPKGKEPDPELFEWLFKGLFHLVAGKALKDKAVPGFQDIDFQEAASIISSVQSHYGLRSRPVPTSPEKYDILAGMAERIGRLSSLGNLTTESLGYIYEHALVTPETRRKLGTHSTPQHLVDYIVWGLADWISELPEQQRHVYEPCCGHAGFLISAMRMLRDLRHSSGAGEKESHTYLKERLHGLDTDPFALEIARLGLTLADVPNPNGWDLVSGDFFLSEWPNTKVPSPDIILMNPPFEKFTENEPIEYDGLSFTHRAMEVFSRMLPALSPGGVFGVVMPESILHGKNSLPLRKSLCSEFEIREITMLGDKVFHLADAESAILFGRKRKTTGNTVMIGRVDNRKIEEFRIRQCLSDVQECSQDRLAEQKDCELRIPRLNQVWQAMSEQLPGLNSIVEGGQGFKHVGKSKLPSGTLTVADAKFSGAARGFVSIGRNTSLHGLPDEKWVSLDDELVNSTCWGITQGFPQIVLNYSRVSRSPWRLKAVCDSEGHPATSRLIVLRPLSHSTPLEYLWALLNSPVGNAFAFCHHEKRDNKVSTILSMPVPKVSQQDMVQVATIAREYLETARGCHAGNGNKQLLDLILQVDAAVLKLYALPPRLERQLLDLFNGYERLGVPFHFDGYFPEDFRPCIPLHTYISSNYRKKMSAKHRKEFRPLDNPEASAVLKQAVISFSLENEGAD